MERVPSPSLPRVVRLSRRQLRQRFEQVGPRPAEDRHRGQLSGQLHLSPRERGSSQVLV